MCGDLVPHVGVTGTPVVDPSTGTAYLVAKSYVFGTAGPTQQKLHALDLATGAERPGFPVTIQGTADNDPGSTFGTPSSNSLIQRTGLVLVDGVVYAGFAGHCDYSGQNAFQGWVFGVGAVGAPRAGQVTARWTSEAGQGPNPGGGIWQSGGALVSDGPGQLLLTTGNGNVPAGPTPGTQPSGALGQAVVRLAVQPDGTLHATDFFAPYDAPHLNDVDGDLGSGAPVGLPSTYQGVPLFGTAAFPHLQVQVGKEGYVYLLNRDDLGGYRQSPGGGDRVLGRLGPDGGTWSKPSVWPGDGGYVYIMTGAQILGGGLNAYHYGLDGSGRPALSKVASATSPDGGTEAFPFGSSGGVVTSDGLASGSAVLWAVSVSPQGAGELRAYDAVPQGSSLRLLGRWSVGNATKFALPAVSGNRVYVGSRDGHIRSFGSPVNSPFTVLASSIPRTTVGQQQLGSVTVRANADVTLDSVSTSNPVLSPEPGPLPRTVAAGSTTTIPVRFAPTEPGIASATIHLGTSLAPFDVAVSGQGQVVGPLLSADPALVSFGSVPVDPAAAPSSQTVTLANDGSTPVRITGVQSPADPQFQVTGLPTPVRPGPCSARARP